MLWANLTVDKKAIKEKNEYMWLLSGIGGVILAYFLNRMAVTKYKRRAIIYLVPAIEETCKTVAGYLTSSILLSHLIFGIAEAVNDYIKASYKINLRASILSILSHSFFWYNLLHISDANKYFFGYYCNFFNTWLME